MAADIPFRDVLSFNPWKLSDQELIDLIQDQLSELRTLCNNERVYNIELALSLQNSIENMKMRIWTRNCETKVREGNISNGGVS